MKPLNLNELIGRKPNGRPCVPTLNFVVGNKTCNMSCAYCVSKMTKGGISKETHLPGLWYKNLRLAFNVANKYDSDTILLTGKGEPTLWKSDIIKIVSLGSEKNFITELQTNGVLLDEAYCSILEEVGLNTIAISRVVIDTNENNRICSPVIHNSPNLHYIIPKIQSYGINVRVTFVAMEGYNDSVERIEETCSWASHWHVKQITIRRMGMPDIRSLEDVEEAIHMRDFVSINSISDLRWKKIIDTFMEKYNVMRVFDWGSISWDIGGVQCLIADCLTVPGLDGTIRYLIYSSDGHLRYSWEHESSIIF